MTKITWVLNDLNEANQILTVLGKLPFESVAELIPRLQQQTRDCLEPPQPAPKPRLVPSPPTELPVEA